MCVARLPLAAALAVLALSATLPMTASAQAVVTGEVGASSASVWRGLTDTNRPILHGAVFATLPVRALEIEGGIWGAVEPLRYDGSGELSLLGHHSGPGVSQGVWWLEATSGVGRTALTAGVTGFVFPEVGGLAETYNTTEVYGIVALEVPLSPSISWSHDVQKVRGGYVEAGIAQEVLSGARGSLGVGATAGWSVGQAEAWSAAGVPQLGYFARNGLTHGDLFTTATTSVGPISIDAEMHLVLGRDSYTRIVAPDERRTAKIWLGMSFGWSTRAGTGGE